MSHFVRTTEVGTNAVRWVNLDHVRLIQPNSAGSQLSFADETYVSVTQTPENLLGAQPAQLFEGPPILSNIEYWVGQLAQVIKHHPSPTITRNRTSMLLNLEMVNKLLNEVP